MKKQGTGEKTIQRHHNSFPAAAYVHIKAPNEHKTPTKKRRRDASTSNHPHPKENQNVR